MQGRALHVPEEKGTQPASTGETGLRHLISIRVPAGPTRFRTGQGNGGARDERRNADGGADEPGTMIGTAQYMSPATGGRQGARSIVRYLLLRRRPIRDGHREPGIRQRFENLHPGRDHEGDAGICGDPESAAGGGGTLPGRGPLRSSRRRIPHAVTRMARHCWAPFRHCNAPHRRHVSIGRSPSGARSWLRPRVGSAGGHGRRCRRARCGFRNRSGCSKWESRSRHSSWRAKRRSGFPTIPG